MRQLLRFRSCQETASTQATLANLLDQLDPSQLTDEQIDRLKELLKKTTDDEAGRIVIAVGFLDCPNGVQRRLLGGRISFDRREEETAQRRLKGTDAEGLGPVPHRHQAVGFLPQQLPAAFAVRVAPPTGGIAGLTLLETAVVRGPAVADLVVVILRLGLNAHRTPPPHWKAAPRSVRNSIEFRQELLACP